MDLVHIKSALNIFLNILFPSWLRFFILFVQFVLKSLRCEVDYHKKEHRNFDHRHVILYNEQTFIEEILCRQ